MLTAPKTTDRSRPPLDETDRLIQGVFEPPNSPALSAIAHYKWLVAVFAVSLGILGAAYGHSIKPTFTSSTTLQVGQVNPNSPGFFGYVQSAASLATTFSRAIDAEQVLDAVQQKLRLAPSEAAARLSAEPIPTSTAFRVIATGPTEAAAVALANVASTALIAYEGQSNSTNPEASSLLHEYQAASLQLRRSTANVTQQGHGKPGYSSGLAAAEAQQNAAEVRVRALGDAYTNAIASQAPSKGLVSLVAGASTAGSDASSSIQKYGFIGLLLGLVVGSLVAVVLGRGRDARGHDAGVPIETPTSQPH